MTVKLILVIIQWIILLYQFFCGYKLMKNTASSFEENFAVLGCMPVVILMMIIVLM